MKPHKTLVVRRAASPFFVQKVEKTVIANKMKWEMIKKNYRPPCWNNSMIDTAAL